MSTRLPDHLKLRKKGHHKIRRKKPFTTNVLCLRPASSASTSCMKQDTQAAASESPSLMPDLISPIPLSGILKNPFMWLQSGILLKTTKASFLDRKRIPRISATEQQFWEQSLPMSLMSLWDQPMMRSLFSAIRKTEIWNTTLRNVGSWPRWNLRSHTVQTFSLPLLFSTMDTPWSRPTGRPR